MSNASAKSNFQRLKIDHSTRWLFCLEVEGTSEKIRHEELNRTCLDLKKKSKGIAVRRNKRRGYLPTTGKLWTHEVSCADFIR